MKKFRIVKKMEPQKITWVPEFYYDSLNSRIAPCWVQITDYERRILGDGYDTVEEALDKINIYRGLLSLPELKLEEVEMITKKIIQI